MQAYLYLLEGQRGFRTKKLRQFDFSSEINFAEF